MRDLAIFPAAFCFVASMAALLYASESGEVWPVPFALFVVVLGGLLHLHAVRERP